MVTFNGINVVQGRFPNNEVDYTPLETYIVNGSNDSFYLRYESNEDLFNLQVAKKCWDDLNPNGIATLDIFFFPYSQMDRKIADRLFSLKYVAQIINDLNFSEVRIWDPHSNVTPALINHCKIKYPIKSFSTISNYDCLFFPDNGAAKKYSEILPDKKYFFGNKRRDLKTGTIIDYEVLAPVDEVANKNILIIDDICMGGRTFYEAGKKLKEMGASNVDLYITHFMPQSKTFVESNGNGIFGNIFGADTLEVANNDCK